MPLARPEIVDVFAPLLQLNVELVPDVTLTVALPLFSPQVVFVDEAEMAKALVDITVALAVAEQPPAPVTVTVYVPASIPDIVVELPPLLQL